MMEKEVFELDRCNKQNKKKNKLECNNHRKFNKKKVTKKFEKIIKWNKKIYKCLLILFSMWFESVKINLRRDLLILIQFITTFPFPIFFLIFNFILLLLTTQFNFIHEIESSSFFSSRSHSLRDFVESSWVRWKKKTFNNGEMRGKIPLEKDFDFVFQLFLWISISLFSINFSICISCEREKFMKLNTKVDVN